MVAAVVSGECAVRWSSNGRPLETVSFVRKTRWKEPLYFCQGVLRFHERLCPADGVGPESIEVWADSRKKGFPLRWVPAKMGSH